MKEAVSSNVPSQPEVSANLWRLMIERISEFDVLDIFEVGSGGSTLGFMRHYFESNGRHKRLRMASFEHWPSFFRDMNLAMADYLSQRCGGDQAHDLRFEIDEIKGPFRGAAALARHYRLLKAYREPPVYNVLGASKSLLLAPVRRLAIAFDVCTRTAVSAMSKISLFIGYYARLAAGRGSEERSYEAVLTTTDAGQFKEAVVRLKPRRAYRVRMSSERKGVDIAYYLTPEPRGGRVFKRRDLDGTLADFEEYTVFPVEGPFNVVYLDGRSRVPCGRRVVKERLLASGGYLFMHDAYKPWYASGLNILYSSGKVYDGSNRRLDGSVLLEKPSGGDARVNRGELLVVKNTDRRV